MDDLRKLDMKYAQEGVHLHQRPLRAARELLGGGFVLGVGANPEVNKITQAYAALVPEVNTVWPGSGIGIAVSVDRVRKLILAVIFGSQSLQPWQVTGFKSAEEWWEWCREDHDIASDASFACADLHDFANGLSAVAHMKPEATELWGMAQSNLENIANTLPSAFSVDSVLQSICMVAELAIKGVLVWNGAHANSFKGKGGHDLSGLAKRMATEMPHRDDPLIASVVAKLPPYVESRYSPAGLTRLQVARLALGVQFIAASTLRRVSDVDLALEMEADGWPAPRRPFFPGISP